VVKDKILHYIELNKKRIKEWEEALSHIDSLKEKEVIERKDVDFLLENADKLGNIMIAHLEDDIRKAKIDLERLELIEEVENDLLSKI
jgi:hypothetical protein